MCVHFITFLSLSTYSSPYKTKFIRISPVNNIGAVNSYLDFYNTEIFNSNIRRYNTATYGPTFFFCNMRFVMSYCES
nr:MAG TPA: hypothetical protein [Caudoviricetes sp.]